MAELRPPELLKEWKSGEFRPVYCLYGDLPGSKAEALSQLKTLFKADDFNSAEFSGDIDGQGAAVVSECLQLPTFSDRRLVVVNSTKLGQHGKAAIVDYLADPAKTTTLILLSDDKKPDPKDSLAKAVLSAGAAVVFAPLGEDEAARRLKDAAKAAGKTLTDEAADVLVAEVGTDWGLLQQELNKAMIYCGTADKIDVGAVAACMGYKQQDPWALSKLVMARDAKGALACAAELLAEGKREEQVYKALNQIVSAVLRQAKAKRLLKTGVPAFQVERMFNLWGGGMNTLNKLSEPKLRQDLKRCLAADHAIKSQAWIDKGLRLEQLIADLCK